MIKAAIFDWGFTIHDHINDLIFPEALVLFKDLKKKGIILILISRASDVNKRWNDFKEFNMQDVFQEMDVIPHESAKEFMSVLNKIKVKPKETIIIGDRVKSEILEGNKIGAHTIWFRNGKFADEFAESEEEKPDYIITSFNEVMPIIYKITS